METTKTKDFPVGSVVVIFSASHLLMRGVGGYLADFAAECTRIKYNFKGGVLVVPGVPVLLQGLTDPFVARLIFELQNWLKTIQDPYPYKTWDLVVESMKELSEGQTCIGTKNKYNVPSTLYSVHLDKFVTWLSEEWTTLPAGVLPLTPEWEEKIVKSLVNELNEFFQLELGKEPSCDRLTKADEENQRPSILMIAASHGVRESTILADRGYRVTICGNPGWRALKGTVSGMAEKVRESLMDMKPSDVIIIQCLDNSSYMSRTEEGGDLPIRQYGNGEYHVDGELVYAGKEKQLHIFKTILPIGQAGDLHGPPGKIHQHGLLRQQRAPDQQRGAWF
jgi:hypothetical protein